jgi:hypothetical protein
LTDPHAAEWTTDGKLLVTDGEKITRIDPDGQNATCVDISSFDLSL